MTFTIKGSHLLAIAIMAVIGYWMFGAEIKIGGQNNATETAQATPSHGSSETQDSNGEAQRFKVSVVEIQSVEREQTVNLRGRTKAEAVIPVRAETAGVLEKRLVKRGDWVNSGDLVCVIDQGARNASLASAKALFEQAKGEFESNKQLQEKGFVTDTTMRQARFNLNSARAQLRQAEIELSWTEVRANASGVVQDPIAEVGDVLTVGGTCITLVDSDPMYFTGQLSERSINDVKVGMKADVQLVTGEHIEGTVNYLAPSADPQTRTFAAEIRLDTKGQTVRDGLTASAKIKLPPEDAIRISPSWLTLEDSGQIGVKIVDEESRVKFMPVTIVSQTNRGFWIAGIEAGTRIITLGQEYVIDGELVKAVPAEIQKAEVDQ
ncbi:MAG: efflux RND transporter periplasmic adaptor subunit [Pseudomonadota bacterium]